MLGVGRVLLSIVAAAAVYLATMPLKRLGGDGIELFRALIGLAGAAAAWPFLAPGRDRVMDGVLRGAGIVGGIGFVGGYFGPIYLSDSNLGPLLGLFITGPLGTLVGALGGGLLARRPGDGAA